MTPEKRAFFDAKYRCTNPKIRDFPKYGGRGIQFKFKSFEQFLAGVGFRPPGALLERINNNGHYEPGNVCWATRSRQNKNRRNWKWKDTSNHRSKH